jgi:hypothetical protein
MEIGEIILVRGWWIIWGCKRDKEGEFNRGWDEGKIEKESRVKVGDGE